MASGPVDCGRCGRSLEHDGVGLVCPNAVLGKCGIPVAAFEWPAWDAIGPLYTLTCKYHPDLRWSTKHITYRVLHYLGLANDVPQTLENQKYLFAECDCALEALIVIGKEGD